MSAAPNAPAAPNSAAAAIQRLTTAMREYLPPDGISKDEFISRVIAELDPGPIEVAAPGAPVVFTNDGNEEQRFVEHESLSCPHCGGSGHRDDVAAAPVAEASCKSDVCALYKPTGVCCPPDSCDIETGTRKASARAVDVDEDIVQIPDGAWLVGDITPDPAGADATGCSIGLALYVEQPNDGGPNIRQGRYDHALRTFIDSMTALPIYPNLWSAPGDITAALGREGGGNG